MSAPNKDIIDIDSNRRATKYARTELLGRVLWALAAPAFRFSPRLAWGWRNLMLRLFKAKIGRSVRIFPTVRIIIPWTLTIEDGVTVGDRATLYALGPMHIGASSTISQGAHLCGGSHDFRDPGFALQRLPITIGAGAWVAADAFIGPRVRVGDAAIIGARAVVTKDVPDCMIVAGNPAQVIGPRFPETPKT